MGGFGQGVRIGLVGVLLSGCTPQSHGVAVAYNPGAPEELAVEMAPNAPFLSQQFSSSEAGFAHRGIDVRATPGTPVLAAADGVVHASFFEPMHGHQVQVSHGIAANGQHVLTTYHHLTERQVERGARVTRGQIVGTLGSSGAVAIANHLHFELRMGPTLPKADPVDPQHYWADGAGRVTCYDPAARYPADRFVITYPVQCL